MNNLSVIVEKETGDVVKVVDDSTSNSDSNLLSDSGLASSASSSGIQQGTREPQTGCPIIEFTALNLAPNVKESTFLGTENKNVKACNISAIMPDSIRITLNSSDGFSDSYMDDEEMLNECKKKPYQEKVPDAKKSEAETISSEIEFRKRVDDAYDISGKKFHEDILPRLPILPNGMRLLGVNEHSPLIESGELYKMRVFRPDYPFKTSEVFEDDCILRYVNISRLITDEMLITKFKVESAIFKTGLMDPDQVGTNAIKGLVESEDMANLTYGPFVEGKVKELVMLVQQISVTKKLKEMDVMELRENCLSTYGGECNTDTSMCHLCHIRPYVNEVARKFEINSGKVSHVAYYRNLDDALTKLCKKLASFKTLILTVDNIEQMLLVSGLELLRFSINTHCRGIHLGSAHKLDYLMSAVRAALRHDVIIECTSYADTLVSSMTAWNDNKIDTADHLRSHLMHFEATFVIGYGLNVVQKKNWNGRDLEGLRATEKELKKKLRIINFNEDLSTTFTPPVFDLDHGTYDAKVITNCSNDDLGKPLLPIKMDALRRVLIR